MGTAPDRRHDPARRPLSAGQAAGLARTINKGEGFSVKAFGPNAGRAASDSYMVAGISGAPEGKIPDPVSGVHIRNYAGAHEDALVPEDRYLGGWRGTLDVSKALPRGDRSDPYNMAKLEATTAAMIAGEDAVGEIDENSDYVGDIPSSAGMMINKNTPDGPVPASDYRSPRNIAKNS